MKEIRSLQKVSKNTYTVSLPIKWIQKNNLSKGDKIEIDAYKNKIILSPHSNKEIKHITHETLPTTKTKIIANYIKGAHQIVIKDLFNEYEKVQLIKFINEYLINHTIEESLNTLIIEIEDSTQLEVMNSFQKLSILALWFMEKLYEYHQQKDEILKKAIIEKDKEVDKLYYFIERHSTNDLLSKHAYILENVCDTAITLLEQTLSEKELKMIHEFKTITEYILKYYAEKNTELAEISAKLGALKTSPLLLDLKRLIKDLSESMLDEIV